MEFQLRMHSTELDDERLQASANELRRLLTSEAEVSATIPQIRSVAGAKGDPIALGTILLTFLTSRAAVSVFKILEAYVSRKRSLNLELRRPDGQSLVLKTQDLTSGQVSELERLFETFVGRE